MDREFDNFDEFADDYRAVHTDCVKFSGTDSDFFSEQKVQEVRKLEDEEQLRILDFGCGDGNSARFFEDYFPQSKYVGLDPSKKSLQVAESRKLARSTFTHFEGFSIPLDSNTFDVAFIACVLHHIEPKNHNEVLAEVHRVLKPGGRLYIFEHNPINPVTRYVVNNCPFDDDAILLGSRYLRRTLLGLKFMEIRLTYILFFPRQKLFQPLLRLERFLKRLPFGGQYFTRAIKR